MRVILTKLDSITSKKDGTKYVILHTLSAKGDVEKVIVSASDFLEMSPKAVEAKLVSSEELSSVFEKLETIDMSFTSRGRLESIVA